MNKEHEELRVKIQKAQVWMHGDVSDRRQAKKTIQTILTAVLEQIPTDGLARCKFCGGEAVLDHDIEEVGDTYVLCTNCLVSVVPESKARAIKAWNRSALTDSIIKGMK